MEEAAKIKVSSLSVDGGASANNFLIQFGSDILGIPTERPECVETTALGASYVCGLTLGVYSSISEIKNNRRIDKVFIPSKSEKWREEKLDRWHAAVKRCLG